MRSRRTWRLRGIFCTWPIQPNHQENHQICRRHKVCCVWGRNINDGKGNESVCVVGHRKLLPRIIHAILTIVFGWCHRCIFQKYNPCCGLKAEGEETKSVDILVYKMKEHESQGSLTTAQNQCLVQICQRHIQHMLIVHHPVDFGHWNTRHKKRTPEILDIALLYNPHTRSNPQRLFYCYFSLRNIFYNPIFHLHFDIDQQRILCM